jgi:hypothetical protein
MRYEEKSFDVKISSTDDILEVLANIREIKNCLRI